MGAATTSRMFATRVGGLPIVIAILVRLGGLVSPGQRPMCSSIGGPASAAAGLIEYCWLYE
jgi:hypothetical protein